VEIRDPYVSTHLRGAAAALTVGAALHNGSTARVRGLLKGTIEGIEFQKEVTLEPGETADAEFLPSEVPGLNVANPRLWWPAKLGRQDLYSLDLQFIVEGRVSHEARIPFGIREVTSTLTPEGGRLFWINGKRILIRGAGYSPDILYRQDPARQIAELTYAADLNLNTVRLEGKLENENFLYVADQLGVLVMAGLMCCDYWQHSDKWTPEDYAIAFASVRDQAMRLRKHPSVFTFLYGSDEAPVPKAERSLLGALHAARWPNPVQAAASKVDPPPASGPTGFKMEGPYDYVPPIYWYTDKNHGGAFGFATEISPGADVPPLESMLATLGTNHLWPIDSAWNYHAGAQGVFTNIEHFTSALHRRYGQATGAEDYAAKAQLMEYESLRAMFEAYSRNKYAPATGVVQWMLNSAWPNLIWHLFDYFLRPGGAYFGAKKGNEYVHAQYSYDDQSIVVVNQTYRAEPHLTVEAALYDLRSRPVFRKTVTLDVPEDSSTRTGIVVPLQEQPGVSFLELDLKDEGGTLVSSNLYWLTPRPDVMAPLDPDSAWYYQAIATPADFTALASMPATSLVVKKYCQQDGPESIAQVTLENRSESIAFFTRVQLFAPTPSFGRPLGREEILPILWDDNYVSVLPGASKTLTARFATAAFSGAGGCTPLVKVSGQNVPPIEL
jgi:exo-1,4-beta-D-glucosaminidase